MSRPEYSAEEIARLGEEIYARDIRAKVEPGYEGEFLVVDVTTGSYEVDESDAAASDRALSRNPDALLYFVYLKTAGFSHAGRYLPPRCSSVSPFTVRYTPCRTKMYVHREDEF